MMHQKSNSLVCAIVILSSALMCHLGQACHPLVAVEPAHTYCTVSHPAVSFDTPQKTVSGPGSDVFDSSAFVGTCLDLGLATRTVLRTNPHKDILATDGITIEVDT